ncbi:YCF1, partial [Symbiodinium sp. KB8]
MLLRALTLFPGRLGRAVMLQLLSALCSIATPLILQAFLQGLEDGSPPGQGWQLYLLAVALYASMFLGAIAKHRFWYDAARVGAHVAAAQSIAVLRHALQGATSVGGVSLANLVTVDACRIQDTSFLPFAMWAGIGVLTTGVTGAYWLWRLLSWSGLVGLLVCALTPPVCAQLGKLVRATTTTLQGKRDKRSNAVAQALSSVLTAKVFAWEGRWLDALTALRGAEHSALIASLLASSSVSLMGGFLPAIAPAVAFALYTQVQGHTLLPSTAFSALLWFSLLDSLLNIAARVITSAARNDASFRRLHAYLSAPMAKGLLLGNQRATPGAGTAPEPVVPDGALGVLAGAKWTYALDSAFIVSAPPSAVLPRTGLILITGNIGSGKSSLLKGLWGDLPRCGGTVAWAGGERPPLAVMQQPPWLGNMSVRDNITLLGPHSPERYDAVVRRCALAPVFQRLAQADGVLVGEGRASALSGGERARAALARCLYSDAAILCLDDPLSALDDSTRTAVWLQAILPEAATRCVIVAVSQLPPGCTVPGEARIWEAREGSVCDLGTVGELRPEETPIALQVGDGAAVQSLPTLPPLDAEVDEEHYKQAAGVVESDTDDEEGATAQRATQRHAARGERSAKGGVRLSVLARYLAAFVHWSVVILLVMLLLVKDVSALVASWWLASWTAVEAAHAGASNGTSTPSGIFGDSLSRADLSSWSFAQGYLGIIGSQSVCQAIALALMAVGAAQASTTLHNAMVKALLHAPCDFFVKTPMGQMMNRCVADVQSLDTGLMQSVIMFLRNVQTVLVNFTAIGLVHPLTLLGVPPLAAIYSWFAVRFRVAARDLRRVGSVLRSPQLDWMHVILDGGVIFRAARREAGALQTYMSRQTSVTHVKMTQGAVQQWVTVTLEVISALIVLLLALLAAAGAARGGVVAARLGLALTSALSLPPSLYWLVRSATKLEVDMVAAERVLAYADMPSEGSLWPGHASQATVAAHSPAAEVKLDNLTVVYPGCTEQAISLERVCIPAGAKVIVAGPSGCGKSTLTKALLAMVQSTGSLVVGGQDLHRLPLHASRKLVGTVLQDAATWSASVADNILGPAPKQQHGALGSKPGSFSHSQADLERCREALQQVGLWEQLLNRDQESPASTAQGAASRKRVGGDEDRLSLHLEADGAPLSAGQRQLLLMARALAQPHPVLVADEVSSHADDASEELLHDIVLDLPCTVLFIAHRLTHMQRFDYVLYLREGEAAASGQAMEESTAPFASFDGTQAEAVAECSLKMQCLPGSVAAQAAEHVAAPDGLSGIAGSQEMFSLGTSLAFVKACRDGGLARVHHLLALTGAQAVDVHVADGGGPEAAFRWACTTGHTDIVRELLALEGARAVDVHAADGLGAEAAFRGACRNGHTDIVLALLALTG